MGKKEIGYLILALSGLLLAVEIYALRPLFVFEYGINTPQVIISPFDYLGDPAILIAVLITVGVFIFGLRLAGKKSE